MTRSDAASARRAASGCQVPADPEGRHRRRAAGFDLGVLHKDDKAIGVRESLLLSAGYISAALIFGAWVWWYLGAQNGMDYNTGFMIEKSLSMDNVFVIALIFSFIAIPRQYQHRVLFWGILGVIVLRTIMIGLGATLVSQFSWVLYLFGAFLIFTGITMWITADRTPDIANNPLLKFLKRHLRVTDGRRGNAFWVQEPDPASGKVVRYATPLLLAPLFIGSKIFLVGIIGKIPPVISLSVTFGLIAGGVLASLWKTRGLPAVVEPT